MSCHHHRHDNEHHHPQDRKTKQNATFGAKKMLQLTHWSKWAWGKSRGLTRILRVFSAHFPRARSARTMHGEYASALRVLSAYFPRIFRAFSAHLKIKKGPIFFIFQNFQKLQKFQQNLNFNCFFKIKNFENIKKLKIKKHLKL